MGGTSDGGKCESISIYLSPSTNLKQKIDKLKLLYDVHIYLSLIMF